MKHIEKSRSALERILVVFLAVIFMVSAFPTVGFAQADSSLPAAAGAEGSSTSQAGSVPDTSTPGSTPAPSTPPSSTGEASGTGEAGSTPDASSIPAAPSTSVPPDASAPVYVVRFLDSTGALVGEEQQVPAGEAAVAPEAAPAPEGQKFTGWSTDAYLDVQENLDVTAVYQPLAPTGIQGRAALAAKQKIWARDLTISDTSKEYGNEDPRPVLIGMPSGLKDGVDYYVEYTRAAGEAVNDEGYCVTVAKLYFINTGYELQGDASAVKEGRLCVTTRKITITANSSSRAYNGLPLTNNTYTVGGSGLASGNTATVAISGTQTVVGASANTVGTVTIRNASSVDVTSSYTITKVNGTLTVTRAPLTIRADNKTIAYGAAPPAYTITYIGFVNGETNVTGLSTQPAIGSTYVTNAAPGAYPITISGAVAANYTITFQPGTLTVNSSTDQITVTADSASKVYDGTPLTKNTFTYTGLPAGHTITATVTGSATTVAQSTPGNNVVGQVIIRNGSNVDVTAYFPNIIKTAGTLTITRAPLTAEMTDLSILFGAPKPSTFPVIYTGFKGSDTQTVLTAQTTATCAYVQGNAPGNYAITGTGAAAANYTVNYLPGVLTVGKNNTLITVTADSNSKTYNGTPLTDNGYTVTGLPAGYTLTAAVTGTATTVAQSTSGNNVVSGVVIIRISDSANVTAHFSHVVLVNGTLSITRAPLTADVDDKTISFNDLAPTYTVTYSGFVGSETAATPGVFTTPITITGTYVQGDAPGGYNITGSAIVAPNYTINYLPGVLTVQKNASQITVTADSDSRVYNGLALTDNGFTYTGLPAGYTVEATVTGTATNVADSVLGNNVISNIIIKHGSTVVTSSFSNIVGINGTLSIHRAPLVAEMTDYVVEFNDPAPAYAVTYTGFVNGETAVVLTSQTTASCSYVAGVSGVGGYPITGSGAAAANYTITYLAGTLTVIADTAQITVMASYDSKTYDGTPLTRSANGTEAAGASNAFIVTGTLAPGDYVQAVVSGTITNVGSASNTVGTVIIRNSINADVTGNYSNIVKVNATLTITPAPLVAKADDKSTEYLEAAPAYTLSYSGFVNGETAATSGVITNIGTASSTYVQGNIPGSYPITGTGVVAPNYAITYQPGTLAVHNNNVEITLVAGYDTKVYDGTPLTKNTYTQMGGALPAGYEFVVTVVGSVTNVADSAPGNNVITSAIIRNISTLTDVTAYFSNIATVNGTLTISPAPLLAQMDNKAVQFASPPPAYTVTYTGFVPGENSTVLLAQTTPDCAYVAGDPVNSYPITGSGAAAANYTITYVAGSLEVTQARMNITVLGAFATKVYDATALTAPTFTVAGTLPADYYVEATVTGTITNVGTASNVVSAVVIKNLSNVDVTANFAGITTGDGTLTVTPAPLTIDVLDQVIDYDDAPPTYTLNYIGFQGGDSAVSGAFTSTGTATSTYVQGNNSGFYPITGAGWVAPNYTITYLPGTLTVKTTEDQVTIMAGSASKVYDGDPLTNSTHTENGLPAGHTVEVVIVGSATNVADSTPGNNVITSVIIRNASNVDVTANFLNIAKVPGTLTITPAPLTVRMKNLIVDFDAPEPTYEAEYTGFVHGETAAVLTNPVVADSDYDKGDDMGTYNITGAGAAALNYAIVYQPGTLVVTVNDDIITVVAASATKMYDGTPLRDDSYVVSGLPAGYTLDAIVEGEVTNVQPGVSTMVATMAALTGSNDISSVVIWNSDNEDVTASFPNITTVSGTLAITPRDVLIKAQDAGKMVGEQDPALTATVTGLVASDTLAYTLQRAPGESVGTYAISVAMGAANPNYLVTTEPGVFTIRNAAAAAAAATGGGGIVRTGDTASLVLWAGLALLAAAGLVALLLWRRRMKMNAHFFKK